MGCGTSSLRWQRGRRDRVVPEHVTSPPSNCTAENVSPPQPIQAWIEPDNERPNTYGGDTKPSVKPTIIVEFEETSQEITTKSNEDEGIINGSGTVESQSQKEVATPECVSGDERKVYSESNLQSKSMNHMLEGRMKLDETLCQLKSKSATTVILTERVERTKDNEKDNDEVIETTSLANSNILAATGNETPVEEVKKSTVEKVDTIEQITDEVHATEDTTSTTEDDHMIPGSEDKKLKTTETTLTEEEEEEEECTTTTVNATETTDADVVDNDRSITETTTTIEAADVNVQTVTETTETTEDTPMTEASTITEEIVTTVTETTSDIDLESHTANEKQTTSQTEQSQTATTGEEEAISTCNNSTELEMIASTSETDQQQLNTAPPQSNDSGTASHTDDLHGCSTDIRRASTTPTQSKSSLSKTSEGTPMIEKIEIDHSTGQSQASLVEAVEKTDEPSQPQSTLAAANT